MSTSRIPRWVYCDDHRSVHRDTCDPLPGLLPPCQPEAHWPVLIDGEPVVGCARCGRPVEAAALVEALCPRCRERLAVEAERRARWSLPSGWPDLAQGAGLTSDSADLQAALVALWEAMRRLNDDE